MTFLALLIYNLALLLLSPVILLALLWRLVVAGKSRQGFGERLGFIPARKLPAEGGPRVWLHAVSVGESVAAAPVWQALLEARPDIRLLCSTTTDTGQATMRKAVGDRGEVIFFPFDLLPCVWLALARARPDVIILMETELWPNFLALARLFGCRVMLANGIISDRTLRGAARLRPLYRWVTGQFDRCCMQSPADAERIQDLGAAHDAVAVTGNTKFDQALAGAPLGEHILLRDALGLQRNEPVVLAGSTHPGEEEHVLRAFRIVKKAHPRARLIIAPRHIQRAGEVEELAKAHGFATARRSKLAAAPGPPDAVIVLDTMGELAKAYALCAAAFVGGSFAPIGGHSVLEPLGLGKPAIFGPHMHKNRDIVTIFTAAGIGFQVADGDALAERWNNLLENPALRNQVATDAKLVFAKHRGAGKRCAEVALELLENR